jgi:hypothetical protein
MSQGEAVWYLPGENQQPAGPFATDDVLARYRAGDITGATLCWCDGMDGWRPLAEVEPFSGALAGATGGAGQGLEELGKTFSKALDFTKRKAKLASLHVVVVKHERRRQQLLSELGEMLYRRASEVALFSQAPYADKLAEVKQVDQLLGSLRDQIACVEKTGGADR